MNCNEIQSAERYAREIGLTTERWSDGPRRMILAAKVKGSWKQWDDYGTAVAHLRSMKGTQS